MCQIMESLKNITWERLENENAITYPCEAPDSSGSEYIFRGLSLQQIAEVK